MSDPAVPSRDRVVKVGAVALPEPGVLDPGAVVRHRERIQRCRRRLRQSLTQPPYFVELPSGVWFEARVGSMRTFYQSGEYANGLVVTDARTLRSRPRSFWAGLLAQLSTDNAPEAGHFVEKASAYLFHPSRAP